MTTVALRPSETVTLATITDARTKTHLHMKGEKGTLILNIKGKDSAKIATDIEKEMSKLGLETQLRVDKKPLKTRPL